MSINQILRLQEKLSNLSVAHEQTKVDLDHAYKHIYSIEKENKRLQQQILELQKQLVFVYSKM